MEKVLFGPVRVALVYRAEVSLRPRSSLSDTDNLLAHTVRTLIAFELAREFGGSVSLLGLLEKMRGCQGDHEWMVVALAGGSSLYTVRAGSTRLREEDEDKLTVWAELHGPAWARRGMRPRARRLRRAVERAAGRVLEMTESELGRVGECWCAELRAVFRLVSLIEADSEEYRDDGDEDADANGPAGSLPPLPILGTPALLEKVAFVALYEIAREARARVLGVRVICDEYDDPYEDQEVRASEVVLARNGTQARVLLLARQKITESEKLGEIVVRVRSDTGTGSWLRALRRVADRLPGMMWRVALWS